MECNLGWNDMRDSKSNECAARVQFEITSMISDQNCMTGGSITTLLHLFWNHPNTGLGQFKYFINAVLSQSEVKFIHFLGGKSKFLKQKLQNLPHDTLCLSFSCNLISYFKQALKSDWLFCFSIASPLAGKKCDLRQKIVQFMNKLQQLEPIRLQGPPEISKWV